MMNTMGAGFVLRAYDKATPVIRRVARGFRWLRGQAGRMAGGMNSAMGATATGFMALRAGLGMLKLSKTAADAASKFQQSLAAVGQISRATASELKDLHGAAIEAALGTKFSPDQTIDGLQTLAAMGLKAAQSIEVLNPVLNLATGSLGQLGVAGAANAVVGTLKALKKPMSEATHVTNQLLKITQMTNFQAKDFAVSMGRVGSTAKLYGQSLEDSLITMGLMRNMNIEATVASTSLREAWRRLASDQRAQQAVEKHGVKVFREKDGSIKDMLGLMSELVVKTQDLDDKERMRLTTIAFGVRGMAAYNSVANASYTVMKNGEKINLEGITAINAMRYELSMAGETLSDVQKESLRAALGVKDLSKVLSSSVGVAKDFRDALLETYEGQKQLVGGAWQTLMVVIGEDFAKAMQPAAKALYEVIGAIARFIKTMSPQAKAIVFKFVVALGGLIALGGGLLLLSGAMSMLGGSLIGFVFSIGKLLVIGAPLLMLLSGLGVGFGSLFKAMGKVGDEGMDLETILTRVRLAVSGAFSILTGEEFSKDLQKNLEAAENKGVVSFLKKFQRWVDRFKMFWAGMKKGFEAGVAALSSSSAFKQFKDKLEGIISIFTGPDAENSPELLQEWADKGAQAGLKLARLGETAADMMGKLIEFGTAFANWMGDISADDVKATIDGFVDGFRTISTVIAGIGTTFSNIYNSIKLVISAIVEGLGFVGTGLASGADTLYARIFGSDEDLAKTKKYYDDLLDTDKSFSWTKSAMGQLVENNDDWQARMNEGARRDVESSTYQKGLNLGRRKIAIEQWVNASPEAWAKATKGTADEGNLSFGEAPAAMQKKFLDELASLNKQIASFAKKPTVIKMDGQKVAEILGDQPSATGEDSLDDVAAVPGF